MIDVKLLRDQPDLVRDGCRRKHVDCDIDGLVRLDARRREIIALEETCQNERNRAAKEIGADKKNGRDTSARQAEMKGLADRIAGLARERRAIEAEFGALMLSTPNLPAADVPEGADASGNAEASRWGEPKRFDFTPKPHWELCEKLGLVDFARGAKVAGTGFILYRDRGARLERALISWFLDLHTRRHGYIEYFPPFLANNASMTGTGQFPKFADDYYTCDKDDGLSLIPTAEVPITNIHRDEILDGQALPLKYCAYSACFRREAGAAGKDTRGLLRVHQFNKVELVNFTRAEDGLERLEGLRAEVSAVFEGLGLHYRVMKLCGGDMSFSAAKCYDFEVWAPGVGKYLECSSCSAFGDFQARRMAIRYRDADRKTRIAHTLNASGAALPRTMAALLETWQRADGSVEIPEVLRPYMNGLAVLEPEA